MISISVRELRPDRDLVPLAIIVCVELPAVLTGEGDGGVEGQLAVPAGGAVYRRLGRTGTEDCAGAVWPDFVLSHWSVVLPHLQTHHGQGLVGGLHLGVILEELAWSTVVADLGAEGNVPVAPVVQ